MGREEDLRLAGEDRSPKKWVEAGMNYGSWRLIGRSGKSSQTTYVPRVTTDFIIIT
jgi:cell division protein FtsW (lipid II flippase)